MHFEGECIKNTTAIAKSSVFSTNKWVIDNRRESEESSMIDTQGGAKGGKLGT